MEKMNCDIIQDLIPSYVDEICSEATRQCVEEHVKTCSECQKMLELCRNHNFSGKDIEKRELDGLKKIRRLMNVQRIVSCLMLFIIIMVGIWTFVLNINVMSGNHYYGWLAVCVVGALLVNVTAQGNKLPGKKECIVGILPLAADVYIALMVCYCINRVLVGKLPFGMEAVKCGPFLERQIIVVFVIQILFLLHHLISMIRSDRNFSGFLCVDTIGIFLMLGNDIMLKRMDTYEGFVSAFLQMTLVTFIIGLAGMIVNIVITRFFVKRKYN